MNNCKICGVEINSITSSKKRPSLVLYCDPCFKKHNLEYMKKYLKGYKSPCSHKSSPTNFKFLESSVDHKKVLRYLEKEYIKKFGVPYKGKLRYIPYVPPIKGMLA